MRYSLIAHLYATERLHVKEAGDGDRARGHVPRGAGGGLGGAHRSRAARGVVRERRGARRPRGGRGGLPLGRRRRAAGDRPRARRAAPARPRLGRRRAGGDRADAGRGRHARPRRRDRARLRAGARAARARVGPGRVDLVFDALGDPGRRSLVRAIAARGDATATELAAELPVTRQAVAKQLAALADAGLLRATRNGRETRYAMTPEPLRDAVAWMVDVGAQWDERLDRLGRSLRERAAR